MSMNTNNAMAANAMMYVALTIMERSSVDSSQAVNSATRSSSTLNLCVLHGYTHTATQHQTTMELDWSAHTTHTHTHSRQVHCYALNRIDDALLCLGWVST